MRGCDWPPATPSARPASTRPRCSGSAASPATTFHASSSSRCQWSRTPRSGQGQEAPGRGRLANGFDAGDFNPFPPYDSMGEAVIGNLQAVGIKSRLRTRWSAPPTSPPGARRSWPSLIKVITAAFGNAATPAGALRHEERRLRLRLAAGDRRSLLPAGARADPKKRRGHGPHQGFQQIIRDKVTAIPLFEQALIWGVGPRVGEAGDGRIPASRTRRRSRT